MIIFNGSHSHQSTGDCDTLIKKLECSRHSQGLSHPLNKVVYRCGCFQEFYCETLKIFKCLKQKIITTRSLILEHLPRNYNQSL